MEIGTIVRIHVVVPLESPVAPVQLPTVAPIAPPAPQPASDE